MHSVQHLPKGMRQLALVQFMHIIHGERMGGVRMHYHAVFEAPRTILPYDSSDARAIRR